MRKGNNPRGFLPILLLLTCVLLGSVFPGTTWALSSTNIPLDSPVYLYLEKLASFGLISSDFRGIRPFTKAEAARLLVEAEQNLEKSPELSAEGLITQLVDELHRFLAREIHLAKEPETAPNLAVRPFSSFRMRYVYLDGVPRSYERLVHDPGGDGVFGIGSGLRPVNPFPALAQQHGSEGTPLFENNEGIRYGKGSNYELRFSSEAFGGRYLSLLLEPAFLYSEEGTKTQGWLNKGYVKLGGGSLELEAGRDANWLGLGYRGNITLTNNARNFDLIKLSSPEPLESKYLWPLKYALIVSRFDETVSNGQVRQPYFFAAKISFKPTANVEFGINLGRQVGGPGVNNGVVDVLKGLVGGTNSDNSNSLAGAELRLRIPFLRNTELYGEFSGEDAALFWPIVESYVAGFYIPRLTANGRDDLRFEYFLGNNILYTNITFPEGYLYKGMPIGHSQGGAVEEFFTRYSHWFSLRNRVAMEYYHTQRGNQGKVSLPGLMQSVEIKNSWRGYWTLPIAQSLDVGLMYGWERIHNLNLAGGGNQTNQLLNIEVRYSY
jgi:Capsule assembly protein Wzi